MMARLQLVEQVQLDKNRLAEIVARLGKRGADDFISRAMEDLAVQLAKVHKGFAGGTLNEVAIAARRISDMATRVGMPGLAHVAGNVATLSRSRDSAALAATVARLGRIGESSLMQVWDFQDLSV